MQIDDVERAWRTDGFAILPGYLSPDDLAPALDELSLCFPTAAGDLTPWMGADGL